MRFLRYIWVMMRISKKIDMVQIMGDLKYKGKHVIVMAGEIFTAKTGKEANKILDRLEKQYPSETPAITYIPKADTLILWL